MGSVVPILPFLFTHCGAKYLEDNVSSMTAELVSLSSCASTRASCILASLLGALLRSTETKICRCFLFSFWLDAGEFL